MDPEEMDMTNITTAAEKEAKEQEYEGNGEENGGQNKFLDRKTRDFFK